MNTEEDITREKDPQHPGSGRICVVKWLPHQGQIHSPTKITTAFFTELGKFLKFILSTKALNDQGEKTIS